MATVRVMNRGFPKRVCALELILSARFQCGVPRLTSLFVTRSRRSDPTENPAHRLSMS
jgi:hypothetical protein